MRGWILMLQLLYIWCMRIRFFHLLASFLVFYVLTEMGMEYAASENALFFFKRFYGAKSLILTFTGIVCFFLYPLTIAYVLKWFIPGKTLPGILVVVLCLPFIIGARFLLQEITVPLIWGFSAYTPGITIGYYFRDNFYFALLYSSFGIVYFFVFYTRYKEKRQAALLLAVHQAELDFLKSQMNPHFLFNSLNNIYSLVYKKSDDALPAVETLSALLRYMLYEKKEKVPLGKETGHLQEYIALQRLRYGTELSLETDMDTINPELMIAPLLLIPFVENAFKHGDVTDGGSPLTISVYTNRHTLLYTVKNKKTKAYKDPIGGIGLENVKRRLDILYHTHHSLLINDEENYYTITLRINLG